MLKNTAVKYAFLPVVAVLLLGSAIAQRIDEYRILTADHPSIGYRTTPADNPMETLRKQLIHGDVVLDFDSEFGYLPLRPRSPRYTSVASGARLQQDQLPSAVDRSSFGAGALSR